MVQIYAAAFEQRLNLFEVTRSSVDPVNTVIRLECLTTNDKIGIRNNFVVVGTGLCESLGGCFSSGSVTY